MHGIVLSKLASKNTINKNNVSQNGHMGIGVSCASNNNLFFGNIISKSHEYGIFLVRMDSGPVPFSNFFFHNSLIENPKQVEDTNPPYNIWDGGLDIGGNFWSNYNGSDLNGDGFGDTPYIVREAFPQENIPAVEDHYPLMSPPDPLEIVPPVPEPVPTPTPIPDPTPTPTPASTPTPSPEPELELVPTLTMDVVCLRQTHCFNLKSKGNYE